MQSRIKKENPRVLFLGFNAIYGRNHIFISHYENIAYISQYFKDEQSSICMHGGIFLHHYMIINIKKTLTIKTYMCQ